MVDGELEYEVQDVVQKRMCKKHIEYLVHWEDYPDYDATWEPVTNIHNAQWLIDAFESVGCHSNETRMMQYCESSITGT